MKLGIDRLITDSGLQKRLAGRKLALAGHPASVTSSLQHSLVALFSCPALTITAAFGPQHGMRGDKQDNMIESADYRDPVYDIPVFSLYGETRRPTDDMMQHFDVLLFDLQDIGCRIYTYATTLLYLMQACSNHKKEVWILDRPNPAGRPIDGTILETGWESFVGAGPMIMRHGLTMGEMAHWFKKQYQLELALTVIEMQGYDPDQAPGYGWPVGQLAWVNPSPNAASLNMARCFAGTVLLEGTELSEGRGTTNPLEVVGAPDIDSHKILERMQALNKEESFAALLRPCYFEPTFHKHQGQLCSGLQIHTDGADYQHEEFKPYRLMAIYLKALRQLYPEYALWRQQDYEYEKERPPIDVIDGASWLRQWVDNSDAGIADLDTRLQQHASTWRADCQDILIY
ncbi:MAG: DUF1343 domain-containing protein [Gammaproteobacteria bacterium]|nr:MAG: DUF1343 domain-containing protein [Gammaproteobacteria bacterium]